MKKILISLLLMNISLVLNAQSNTTEVTNMADPEICMVTCNESGTNNEIRWDPELMPQAETVVIFILNEQGAFVEIGRQSAEDGVYTDNGSLSGNPNTALHKYRIQVIDKKESMSKQSLPHQSIFIKGNQKGNFVWNVYEIAPTDANGKIIYHLWRQSIDQKPVEVLSTEKTTAIDPDFKNQQGKGTIWWVELGNFSCEGGKNGTKSNNSNE